MMRLVFGALLGLLVAFPPLLGLVLTAVLHPVVLAVLTGVLVWPRLARTLRGWAA
ncbi:hypothetical protein [Streptomyces sp. NPDC055140]